MVIEGKLSDSREINIRWDILRFAFLIPYPVITIIQMFSGDTFTNAFQIAYRLTIAIKMPFWLLSPVCDIVTLVALFMCRKKPNNLIYIIFTLVFWAIHIGVMATTLLSYVS